MESEILSSTNSFYQLHCRSIQMVMDLAESNNSSNQDYAKLIYDRFTAKDSNIDASLMTNYENRSWQFIISWKSEIDGKISFAWLQLPKNWAPEEAYPIYVQLHGFWDVADNPIEYLSYPFRNPSSSFAFEDGYRVSPWGRGNLWYRDIAEDDIWECIENIKKNYRINAQRQYLLGHSMGGYGTWHIAHQSAHIWAGIGIHAGAIWYNNRNEVKQEIANKLKQVPTYFVCGTEDNNLSINEDAYKFLENAGNADIEFTTFEGGHVYRQQDVEAMYLWLREFTNENYSSTTSFALMKNNIQLKAYPNPTTDFIEISYDLQSAGTIDLSLYNCTGQRLKTINKQFALPGSYVHKTRLNSHTNGIYFIRLKTEQQEVTQKIILNR